MCFHNAPKTPFTSPQILIIVMKNLMKDKYFFTNLSDSEVVYVEECASDAYDSRDPSHTAKVAYFDGMSIVDNVGGWQDDIQQVFAITKEGFIVCLEDYYSQYGAYDKDKKQLFRDAIANLMTHDEYEAYYASVSE